MELHQEPQEIYNKNSQHTHPRRRTPPHHVIVAMDHRDLEDGIAYADQLRHGLLQARQRLTESLGQRPYDLILYLQRANVHSELGYPDLAAGDSYRALLLTDEVCTEGFEYHELALAALRSHSADDLLAASQVGTAVDEVLGGVRAINLPRFHHNEDINADDHAGSQDGSQEGWEDRVQQLARRASVRCYQILAISLLLCGCLKSAYEFCERGRDLAPDDEELQQAREYIQSMARRRLKVDEVFIQDLPDRGLVRREIYPWNDHEPDRFSPESLEFLNHELAKSAKSCEVRISELPTLLDIAGITDAYPNTPTNKQLGIFATEDIGPGETILDEVSILTVNSTLGDSLCDACSTELPPLGPNSPVVGCPYCDDTMFCNQDCLDRAQDYHPAVCDKDVDTALKDPEPNEIPNTLYLLLLSRALAMSATQSSHPLDLKEIKYIWGDFMRSIENEVSLSINAEPPPIWTLPFSFASNISGPIHILEKMDIDVFQSLATYDLWIFNTLYSKFRGTASARVSPRDGRPEVAAVHPLWCLANHDCDPNVRWEWGGRMKFWCRERRYDGAPGGIKAGEEILSHYCDIDLKVKDRRAWAKGSLSGSCMCKRCLREAALERLSNGNSSDELDKEHGEGDHVMEDST